MLRSCSANYFTSGKFSRQKITCLTAIFILSEQGVYYQSMHVYIVVGFTVTVKLYNMVHVFAAQRSICPSWRTKENLFHLRSHVFRNQRNQSTGNSVVYLVVCTSVVVYVVYVIVFIYWLLSLFG